MLCKLNKLLTSLSLVFRNFDCEPIFNELKSYILISTKVHIEEYTSKCQFHPLTQIIEVVSHRQTRMCISITNANHIPKITNYFLTSV